MKNDWSIGGELVSSLVSVDSEMTLSFRGKGIVHSELFSDLASLHFPIHMTEIEFQK